MRTLFATGALIALSVCWINPALAKHAATHHAATQPAQPAQPPALADQDGKVMPSADLTGQTIYTSTGNLVGRVLSMAKGSQGLRAAVVSTGQRLGIGGVNILLTIDKLQAREKGGGFFTNLTQAQVRALPKAP